MRIGRLDKTKPWKYFSDHHFNKKNGAFTIKGTDAIVIKSAKDSYFYCYSKNTSLGGSHSYDRQLHANLVNKGYCNWICMYSSYEWELMSRRLKNSSFTKADVEATIREVVKGTGFHGRIQRTPEYGVELELETPNPMTVTDRNTICESSKLIHDVGGDPSVHCGCEIRFNHPALRGWKMKDIKLIMNTAKSLNAETTRGTAGMHIHISRKDIKDIVKKFEDNLPTMQQILYPTNCRKLKLSSGNNMYYGVEGNIFRNQLNDFGTLEIRAWNATLDPKLFMERIKFCKYFCDWLADAKEISVEKFFEDLTDVAKKNYKYLVNHAENPHQWGMPLKAVNAMLA